MPAAFQSDRSTHRPLQHCAAGHPATMAISLASPSRPTPPSTTGTGTHAARTGSVRLAPSLLLLLLLLLAWASLSLSLVCAAPPPLSAPLVALLDEAGQSTRTLHTHQRVAAQWYTEFDEHAATEGGGRAVGERRATRPVAASRSEAIQVIAQRANEGGEVTVKEGKGANSTESAVQHVGSMSRPL